MSFSKRKPVRPEKILTTGNTLETRQFSGVMILKNMNFK
jgi:hypothetical protein